MLGTFLINANADIKTLLESSEIQVWAHRGDTTQHDENTIESISAALANKALGIEIDLYFDKTEKKFIVTHDAPIKEEGKEFLYLEDIFRKFPTTPFWLDLKNLSLANVKDCRKRLDFLTLTFSNKKLIIIESTKYKALAILSKNNYYTSLWTGFSDSITSLPLAFYLRIMVKLENITAVSTDARYYNWVFTTFFKGIPHLLFIVNSEKELKNLAKQTKDVRILLTDKPKYYTLKL